MAKAMKTPGVYIVEKDAFPNSVVQVETAVPAFIGHTEKALNGSTSLDKTPWRISSMAEFERFYGGAPKPVFEVADVSTEAEPPFKDLLDDAKIAEADPLPRVTFALFETDAAGAVTKKTYELKQTSTAYTLHGAMRLFFRNGGGPCWVVSIGDYSAGFVKDEFDNAIGALQKEQEPTMVVIPETTRLKRQESNAVQEAMLTHCGDKMKNRFAILDMFGGHYDPQSEAKDPVKAFRDKVTSDHLKFGATYYPWIHTSIYSARDFSFENIDSGNRGDFGTTLKGSPEFKALEGALATDVEAMIDEMATVTEEKRAADIHKTLGAMLPLYAEVMNLMAKRINCMPPGAAMAGLYTMVDNTRGVWKAPANVGVQSVVAPTVNISHQDQEGLNVSTTGKSINAIRPFVGEGTLVWGARTLDGNSLDWRYISVRRTMIMLEESIKLAAKAYVFEPNTANTWVTMRSMIENFLTSIWKQGGLAGAVPEDAFSVHVGLGETMTSVDILEGILRITVLVAVTRPAEFIEITFQQQMQKS